MMRHLAIGLAAALVLGAAAAGAAEVKSLRGGLSPDAPAKLFQKKKYVSREGGFKRAWKLQPPLIPHKIDKERISLQENTCFRCHSPDTYKAEKAPMISKTHFKDPQHPKEADLIRMRWFCYQCHVPQVDAPPLVENKFKSAGK